MTDMQSDHLYHVGLPCKVLEARGLSGASRSEAACGASDGRAERLCCGHSEDGCRPHVRADAGCEGHSSATLEPSAQAVGSACVALA